MVFLSKLMPPCFLPEGARAKSGRNQLVDSLVFPSGGQVAIGREGAADRGRLTCEVRPWAAAAWRPIARAGSGACVVGVRPAVGGSGSRRTAAPVSSQDCAHMLICEAEASKRSGVPREAPTSQTGKRAVPNIPPIRPIPRLPVSGAGGSESGPCNTSETSGGPVPAPTRVRDLDTSKSDAPPTGPDGGLSAFSPDLVFGYSSWPRR
jgi:hypothetical protein